MDIKFLELAEAEINKKFPLLQNLQIGSTADSITDSVPKLVGLVAAVMESRLKTLAALFCQIPQGWH